ncbi:PREDICTED: uncharacterized protein LOC104723541 [Camelina sativa]|uniref:Uncharacterized protein LOC104723538 n=1 Tax=Camelina sativa TaxID=90675 RepID=A0ABM0UF27_CAMSA|nr:PREDICTED: uncharacterized protein LOC104723538 [Camelina sativa]XP_010440221.1 PREDICTED: uncharacterized protein LOC104723539 [Camelina sativa]XP_010440222.1 PREDICTED: uncharacterized protein LOC104723540 [Camelina sativa]XP_010440223.1 PREDICTED: uncharacterized protein LOC104723541 [Camelina sativa]
MELARKDRHAMIAGDGLQKHNRNTSMSNPNIPYPCNTNLSSLYTQNSSYIYYGPQVRTVKESITSSTSATFLVYQCSTS